jgi:dipeptidyl aminopeptidase/acylaminoacyl peptidase
VRPGDIGSIVSVGAVAVSPDGATIAFVVTRVDVEPNAYRSRIWLAAADGSSRPVPLTAGEVSDSGPAWSPDGSRLAYSSRLGDEADAKVAVRVVPVTTGGEVLTLATLKEGVRSLSWSPDGRRLAFVARARASRYEHDDPRRQPPRRITRFFSRLDNEGWTADRPEHVFVVSTEGTEPHRDVTPGEFGLADPVWAPDGSSLVVAGATHDTWDLDLRVDLHLVDVESGERRPLTSQTGIYGSPSVSPDGRRVALLGTDDAETHPRNYHVGVIDLVGGQHRWVSRALDRNFAPYPDHREPIWLDDETLLAKAEDRGNEVLLVVRADGDGEPLVLRGGPGCIPFYDWRAGTLAFAHTVGERPAELHAVVGGDESCLTEVAASFVRRARPRPFEHFTVPSRDGAVELDAWILTPPDLDRGTSHPALLNVHGGPFLQYGDRFFDEVQIQAGAGYVAVWCNPRGGSGREEGFGRAICGPPLGGTGWGSVDYDDLMAVMEHALEVYPFIDRERLGVLGGSYGGYMTTWIVSHTDRFAAACSERACNNLLSLEWTSDIGTAFRTEMGATHLDDPELYLRHSPITYVRDISTPVLILHSEDDLRCPVEQAEQLFVALRLLGKEVEFVRFPAEGHELSRTGSPVHRIQRAELILEFFDKHLKR